jgi:hypothetical protein
MCECGVQECEGECCTGCFSIVGANPCPQGDMCRVAAFQRRTSSDRIPTVIARPAAAAAAPALPETAGSAAAGTVPPQPCAPPPSSSETTGSAAAGTVPPQPCAPPPSSSETTGSVAPGYDQRFFDMLARAKYVFDCTIRDKKTPARTLVAICWRIAYSLKKDLRSEAGLEAPPVPSCLQEGWNQRLSECEIQPEKYYNNEHTEAARWYILKNRDSSSFEAQFNNVTSTYITKPLGAGGKKTGLACAICVACSHEQNYLTGVPNMLYSADGRSYGSMQLNIAQTDTHCRCQKHQSNVDLLDNMQNAERVREEQLKRSREQRTQAAIRSVSGDASNQRTRSVRSVDALIDVIGGRWRDVWREEKQCYYNLGYEDCKAGGQKRKFNAKADT